MSYDTVETGVKDVIQLLANYTVATANVTKGDYRALVRGLNRAVVLQPGAIPERQVVAAPRRVSTLWEVQIELYVGFRDEVSTIASLIRTARQELIDHLDKYPTLNGVANIVSAFVVSGSRPDIWLTESLRWWRQVLLMQVEERATVTIAE